MEDAFKKDVIREVREGQGRILLHDEVEERPNVFTIEPIWEAVTEEDIMTPRDVFQLMTKEGYKVCALSTSFPSLAYKTFKDRLRTYCSCEFHIQAATFIKLTNLQTDEQAPLPSALAQLYNRVKCGYSKAGDFVFNCQMGRGRTTTGMITACLIATTMNWKDDCIADDAVQERITEEYDNIDGPSEEEAYLQGSFSLDHPKMSRC